jgi:hypothetical protein
MNANKKSTFAAVVAAVLMSAGASSVQAYQFPTTPPDWTVPFDAGMACQFPLTVEGWEGKTNTREYTDADGNQNTVITGKGHDFRFTNPVNGKVTTQKSQGVRQHIEVYADGSQKIKTTGALLLIMFPTDIPAGPTTNYYNGNTVLTIAADGVGTLQKAVGHNRDICAELN